MESFTEDFDSEFMISFLFIDYMTATKMAIGILANFKSLTQILFNTFCLLQSKLKLNDYFRSNFPFFPLLTLLCVCIDIGIDINI